MPPIITGLSLLIFFRETDMPRSLADRHCRPHRLRAGDRLSDRAVPRLQALRPSLVDASLDLGASRWQTFRFVLMPNLMPAFVSSAILAFALSFDETLITLLVTGTEEYAADVALELHAARLQARHQRAGRADPLVQRCARLCRYAAIQAGTPDERARRRLMNDALISEVRAKLYSGVISDVLDSLGNMQHALAPKSARWTRRW